MPLIPLFIQNELDSGDVDLAKRLSAFNFCNPFDNILPFTDGSVGSEDRAHLWGLYSGISISGAGTTYAESISFTMDNGYSTGNVAIMGESVTYGLDGGFSSVGSNTILENITFTQQNDLNVANNVIFTGTITLGHSVNVSVNNQVIFTDEITFSATLDQSVTTNMTMLNAITLSIEKALSAIQDSGIIIPIQSIELCGIVGLTSSLSGTIDLTLDLSGEADLIINLEGKTS